MAAVTERKAWEAAGVTRLREANTGKNAGIANRAAAEAARDTLTAIPGLAMAAVTTASKEETARAGSDTPTGGMETVAAAADMVADMADTAAVMLPATAAALGAGVAMAAVAVATKRHCPMCPPDRMQDCAIYTSNFYSNFLQA